VPLLPNPHLTTNGASKVTTSSDKNYGEAYKSSTQTTMPKASHQTEVSLPTLASPHDAQQNSGQLSQHAAASPTLGAHHKKSAQLYQTTGETTNGSRPMGTLLAAPLTTGFRLTSCKTTTLTGEQGCLSNHLEGYQLYSYSLGNQPSAKVQDQHLNYPG